MFKQLGHSVIHTHSSFPSTEAVYTAPAPRVAHPSQRLSNMCWLLSAARVWAFSLTATTKSQIRSTHDQCLSLSPFPAATLPPITSTLLKPVSLLRPACLLLSVWSVHGSPAQQQAWAIIYMVLFHMCG